MPAQYGIRGTPTRSILAKSILTKSTSHRSIPIIIINSFSLYTDTITNNIIKQSGYYKKI